MKKTTLALLISILALFLRTYVAYNSPIEFDESVYATAAAQYNLAARQGDWKQILNSTNVIEHPQFFQLVYAVGLMVGKPIPDTTSIHFGNDIQSVAYWHHLFILRMISVFFGTATVFLISMINPLAGLFLAIDTYAIKYTSVIYLEALPAFTSLAALIAALKSLKAYQKLTKNWKVWIGWLVLSSLFLGVTAASKYIYSLVGIVIIISVIIQGWKHRSSSLLGLVGWGILALAFFFIFDPILWHSPLSELIKSINYNTNYSLGKHVEEVGYQFWQPIKWLMISIPQYPNNPTAFFLNKGDYFISADSLIFILALVGLPDLWKRNKPMFIWLIVGLTFLLLWGTKWPQYILLVLVPFCISAAYGFSLIRLIFIKLKSSSKEQSNSTTVG
jgi:hypothetical protein